jgi:hypothetical protein
MKTYSKRTVVTNERNAKNDELTDRLNHYNDWLMDDKRDSGSTYPGYPGDKGKKPTATVVEKPVVAPIKRKKGVKAVMNIETVGVKMMKTRVTRGPKAGTKQDAANKLVAYLGTADKAGVIEQIMQKLDMSKAGATTYFHNAKRFLATAEGQSLANPD